MVEEGAALRGEPAEAPVGEELNIEGAGGLVLTKKLPGGIHKRFGTIGQKSFKFCVHLANGQRYKPLRGIGDLTLDELLVPLGVPRRRRPVRPALSVLFMRQGCRRRMRNAARPIFWLIRGRSAVDEFFPSRHGYFVRTEMVEAARFERHSVIPQTRQVVIGSHVSVAHMEAPHRRDRRRSAR